MGVPQAVARPPGRRSDAGHFRLQQRDLDGLLLIADHYAAPYDLLAQALPGILDPGQDGYHDTAAPPARRPGRHEGIGATTYHAKDPS